MNFTPWTLLIDVGLISALLLLGKLIRAKVKFIQRLFIPPSLLAGFAGLVLGPEVLGWLPLSAYSGTYASILIALVFSALPFTSKRRKGTKAGDDVGKMWAYSQGGMLLQWALGGMLGFYILAKIWDVTPAFGLALPAGFCGGHGTAAAIGEAFAKYGVETMTTPAMTSATVGILAAIILGIWRIKWATLRGQSAFLDKYEELPEELRTGILPKEKRGNMGESSFSAISLDSMTFNVGVLAFTCLCGYGISKLIAHFFPALMLPVFSCAFIAGLGINGLFKKGKIKEYLSDNTLNHLSATFTDYLVAFGVASIRLEIVARCWVPLAILLATGLALTYLYVFRVGRRMFRSCWFEKSIFTWGWFTGTMAMSIALLRIADSESKSGVMDDYAFAYIYIAPVEIALITFAPVAFFQGFGPHFPALCLIAGAGILGFAGIKGWFKKSATH